MIHSLRAVKIGSQAAGWEPEGAGGSGPAHQAPRTELRLSTGRGAGAAEGLMSSKPRVPPAAGGSPAPLPPHELSPGCKHVPQRTMLRKSGWRSCPFAVTPAVGAACCQEPASRLRRGRFLQEIRSLSSA